MRIQPGKNKRRGIILPYIAISLIALLGFIALAIDLGAIMVAKTQTQNATDAAAFAGARTLTGGTSANTSQATTNGQAVAAANTVLGTNIATSNVTITLGAYHYDSTSQTFYPQYPPVSPDNYNLAKAQTSLASPTFFAQVFGISSMNVAATSVAAHRPRDTAIVLDFSGSMNNESDLWNCESYQGSFQGTPNNTDSVYPQWGYYNTTFSPLATIQCTSTSDLVGYCNITQSVGGCGAQVNDYYQNARGASPSVAAFTNTTSWAAITVSPTNQASSANAGFASYTLGAQSTLSSTQPAGDWAQTNYRSPSSTLSNNPTYGQTITNAQSGRSSGTTVLMAGDLIPNTGSGTAASPYNGIYLWGSSPVGYTLGPKYWGGTFFTWPPDPNNDWRQLYFLASDGTPWKNSLNTNTTATSTSSTNNPSAYPNNSAIFASNGLMNSPTGNYQINYKAILAWISANLVQQSAGDGRPFPTMLRSSNCTLYSYIPTDVPVSNYTWANGNSNISDSSVRFWKEYIDFVIGVWRDPTGNIQIPGTSTCSYGPAFTSGTSTGGQYVSISGVDSAIYNNGLVTMNSNGTPSTNQSITLATTFGSGYTANSTVTLIFPDNANDINATGTGQTNSSGHIKSITITNPGSGYTSPPTTVKVNGSGTAIALPANTLYLQQYTFMNPSDNPKRPRHGFWFGPQTMVQYMMDTGILPGVTTDISMLPAKLGIQGALTDIQNNHPNDMVSMLMFSRPHYSGEPTEVGQFTYPVNSFSRDYTSMINSLWYPPNSSTTDVTPWDTNGLNTPHAHADYDSNTCTSYGLMLAYNQFSSSSVLSGGTQGGGLGRKGAQRLLILETDGMANQASSVPFVQSVSTGTNPTNNSYFNIGGDNATTSGTDPSTDAINIATQMCNLTTNSSSPGFATATKPVTIHCIAFGALFEPDANGAAGGNAAMSLMQSLSALGGTGFPASVTDTTSAYYYKLCIGTLAQRQSKLQTAFTTIMDDGISIIMVQ